MTNQITMSRRANIAVNTLPKSVQKKVNHLVKTLQRLPANSSAYRHKVRKLKDSDYFIVRVDNQYRMIFTQKNNHIEIFDVFHHDRLELFRPVT